MPGRTRDPRRDARVDYRTLADLRYHIRRFLRVRETAARKAGIEPQQYQALLQVKGLDGQGPVTIRMLAERLQIQHHSTVEIVNRLQRRRFVTRHRDTADRREVVVRLTGTGTAMLRKLALHSLGELRTAGPELVAVLVRLIGEPGRRGTAMPQRRGGTGR